MWVGNLVDRQLPRFQIPCSEAELSIYSRNGRIHGTFSLYFRPAPTENKRACFLTVGRQSVLTTCSSIYAVRTDVNKSGTLLTSLWDSK
ncbi:unnamed protein product [Cochlearia groenlandica]